MDSGIRGELGTERIKRSESRVLRHACFFCRIKKRKPFLFLTKSFGLQGYTVDIPRHEAPAA